MCDFHSIIGVSRGEGDCQIYHDTSNSHSGMAAKIGVENKPNQKTILFECEWDGKGRVPADDKLIRYLGECPEPLVKKIKAHYAKLAECLATGKHLDGYFKNFEKYSDVWIQAVVHGRGVTFPEKMSGSLYLSALTTLPEGVTFPEKMSGSLDLRALTTLPEGVTFPEKMSGYLYLRADLKAIIAARKKSKN